MNLDQLKNRLDQIGYNARLMSFGALRVGKSLGPNEDGLNLFRFYCDISSLNNKFVVVYGTANLQEEILFNTESQVVRWIKKEFPQ